MNWQYRGQAALHTRRSAGARRGFGFSDSADYSPLTIVPSTSRPKRSITAWLVVATAALVGLLGFAVQRGVAAW